VPGISDHPEVRDRLQGPNVLLPCNLHFGCPVFDEFAIFLTIAEAIPASRCGFRWISPTGKPSIARATLAWTGVRRMEWGRVYPTTRVG
jgi:hypothetical protein